MNESTINLVCTTVGTLLGVLLTYMVTYITQIKDKKYIGMKKNIITLAWQVRLFYELEKEYLDEWTKKFPSENIETVKKSFRKKINDKHESHKIEMTENKAKEIINKYS